MISLGVRLAALVGKTVTQQQAKRIGAIVGIPLLVIAGVLLLLLGKSLYDRSIREQAQDQRDAEVAIGAREADQAADDAVRGELAETQAENERLEDAMNDAVRDDPTGAAKPVGPVQQSYFDNLPEE